MRKAPKYLSFLFILTALFGACDNFESSSNGVLDGFWQLVKVDTIASGQSADMRERLIFWSVQSTLIELRDLHTDKEVYGPNAPDVFFHFEHTAESLHLLSSPPPVIYNWRVSERANERVANHDDVMIYGLSRLGEDFRILRLTNESMTLQSESLRMYFRKY